MKIKLKDITEGRLTPEQGEAIQTYFQEGGTWQELLQLETDEVEHVYATGYQLYQDREFDKALATFSTLIQVNPYEAKHWVAIGATLQAKEEFSDALASYEIALTLQEEASTLFYCAQCAYGSDEKEKCREYLLKTIIKEDGVFSSKARAILTHLDKDGHGKSK